VEPRVCQEAFATAPIVESNVRGEIARRKTPTSKIDLIFFLSSETPKR